MPLALELVGRGGGLGRVENLRVLTADFVSYPDHYPLKENGF
jgi:hypothetical protein